MHAKRVTTAILAGTAMAILIGGAMVAVSPREAAATPQYAQQTKKACGGCHVNPAGGGKLNEAGEKFKANGHK